MTYEEMKKEFSKLPSDTIITICKMMSVIIDAVKMVANDIEEIANERAESE